MKTNVQPAFKRRRISAVRDFPFACGRGRLTARNFFRLFSIPNTPKHVSPPIKNPITLGLGCTAAQDGIVKESRKESVCSCSWGLYAEEFDNMIEEVATPKPEPSNDCCKEVPEPVEEEDYIPLPEETVDECQAESIASCSWGFTDEDWGYSDASGTDEEEVTSRPRNPSQYW
ncbi:hypothetical protein QQ045_024282 [Rhodiola kirilowii]